METASAILSALLQTLRRAASLSLARACLFLGLVAAGCRNPSVGVTAQPFVNSAAPSGEAVKVGVHVGDVFGGLWGMEKVAAGLEFEYSRYADAEGRAWRYWRVGSPVVSLRKRRTSDGASPGGVYDAFKGWPALSAENERIFFGLPPRRRALVLGLGLKGLEPLEDTDEEPGYLFVGPYWGFGSLWSPKGSPCGVGFMFEVDTGLDLYTGTPYGAVSLGLWMTFGRPRHVPFTTDFTLPPKTPLPPEPAYPPVDPFVEGINQE